MPADIKPIRIVPSKRIGTEYIDYALAMLDEAVEGKITAFAWVAAGSDFATWVGRSGPMTRQDRMNIIGQLHLMIRYLEDEEMESR